ncbi:MAG TPA: DinB family protein [Acidimicrobiia bacterium]|nr:DinB family protein [Acidimicrobiia bacterium]
MNPHELITTQFQHGYWATDRLLDQAIHLTDDEFASTPGSTRDLRSTLVHTLDTEWSWRLRLQGEAKEIWEVEMKPEDFPTVAVLVDRWYQDREQMLTWLAGLTEDDLASPPPAEGTDHPLWYYLLHINHHSALARADAAALLTDRGHSPGDLDFLDYISSRLS